jgi:histidine kinase/DNA gyrase B/HSP90-like ATPase
VNSHIELSVSDTGEGIDPDYLPHVFERFSQGERPTAKLGKGLGLGLAIVKHLAELHGGSVRAKSGGPGKGSTFIVSLPISVVRSLTEGEPGRRRSRERTAIDSSRRCGRCPRTRGGSGRGETGTADVAPPGLGLASLHTGDALRTPTING